ncbi:MAG: sulfatase-like hydrolase/transferase [Verrucomicrobia bacterium]|nr:sulfatase-like hydrolase/transferase [Verrucomicrobiota bacterium]
MKSKMFMLATGLVKLLAPGAIAGVAVEDFQTQSITPDGLTNSYGGVTIQAGDAIVMTAGSNKKHSVAPISFSSSAGTFVPVNTSGLSDPYPCAYTAYLIAETNGTYDCEASATGSVYAQTGLYVLRADSGELALLDSATYANNDGNSEADQTLTYEWGGADMTNAVVIEAVSSRTSLITPADVDIDASAVDKRLLCSTNFSGTSFSSTYGFSDGTVDAMTSSGAGLIFSENGGAPPPDQISPSEGTNVLFIAIDDMKTLMGCYGDAQALTPRIDGLASNGVTFLNAQCQWAVCGPSRASIMTGLMPEQNGVMGFVKMRHNDNAQLHDLVTLPQHFKNNGYETAATGKLNDPRCVGSINPDGTVNDDGSTVDDPPSWSTPYVKAASGQGSTTAYSPDLNATIKLAAESVDLPDSSFGDGSICDEGITLLQTLASGDKPFFLGVGFKKPHLPFLAPKQYFDLYSREDFTPHPNGHDQCHRLHV